MKTFKEFLTEVLADENIKNNTWYHGTTMANAEKIMKDGFLKPSEIVTQKTKTMMAPIHNRVYMTRDIEEALGYALMRAGRCLDFDHESKNRCDPTSAIIVIDGKDLQDVIPDEDIIADLVPDYVGNRDEKGNHKAPWLIALAKIKAPKAYEDYIKRGDYSLGTKLGKILIKYLSDDQKKELIRLGKKMAHEGPIKIKEVWKIDNYKRAELKKNPEKFRSISEKIFG